MQHNWLMRCPRGRGTRTVCTLAGVLLVGTGASACGGPGDAQDDPAPSVTASIIVSSPDFNNDEKLPQRYTCDGAGQVPRLHWTDVPKDTKALAVLVDDPDAPAGPYVHWLVLDLPAGARSLSGHVPAAAHQARDSAGKTGWTPPCPPSGDQAHHYRFTVYALRKATGLPNGVDDQRAKNAIDELAIGRGQVVATYKRHS